MPETVANPIHQLLISLGLSTPDSVVPYHPRVRDREDLAALRCTRSGVIFLSRADHMSLNHYAEIEGFRYWSADDRRQAINAGHEDKCRRVKWLENIVANKKWLDVGTGSGGILDALAPIADITLAVEPQKQAIESLTRAGYKVYPTVNDVHDRDIDIVTLFHVLEHFTDPLSELSAIHERMKPGGKLYIEISHANDFLLSFLDLSAFKDFTLWSEHLILHTRTSLHALLHHAGFNNITIEGCQRYPLANHLHWLAKCKPGGHFEWDMLRTDALDKSYAEMLARLDRSDTLLAVAKKPS